MKNYSDKVRFIEKMKNRTKDIAVKTIIFCNKLKYSTSSGIISKQLIRSVTSVGANYRAVCRSRSKAEFYAKLSITVEEADETLYWYELLSELPIKHNSKELLLLKNEMIEILSVLSKARKNTN